MTSINDARVSFEHAFELQSGGVITIRFNMPFFGTSRQDMDFLNDLAARVREYEYNHASARTLCPFQESREAPECGEPSDGQSPWCAMHHQRINDVARK